MMSLGVPLFVWDLSEWHDMGAQWVVPASSVPYWDDTQIVDRILRKNYINEGNGLN